jgi:hypothetical protein
MPGMFPSLEGFFKKRTPPGVQNNQPGLFQQMPQMPQQPMPGQQRQQAFNQEQRRLNTGMIGGRNNRRSY